MTIVSPWLTAEQDCYLPLSLAKVLVEYESSPLWTEVQQSRWPGVVSRGGHRELHHPRRHETRGRLMATTRKATCTVGSCDRVHQAHGLCHAHYQRLRHTGTTNASTPVRPWRPSETTTAPTRAPSARSRRTGLRSASASPHADTGRGGEVDDLGWLPVPRRPSVRSRRCAGPTVVRLPSERGCLGQ